MEQVCLSNMPELAGGVIATIVTVASILANVIKADSLLGKIVHFMAINLTHSKK